MRTKTFGKLEFLVIIRDRGEGGGGEYDMRQSTPVSQSVVSSAHKSAVGTAELRSGEEEDTYDDETTH